jgi:catalase
MTLNQNPTDHHTQIEQLAFEPNNLVPGIGLSPDRMLLARGFAYSDAHRARIGGNYRQIPVNASKSPVHSYSKDGAMRVINAVDPVYAPNSKGGPAAATGFQTEPGWAASGEIVRSAYVDHPEDDDFGQAGTMVREVLDDAARERLTDNIVGHLLNGVSEPVLARAFEYWRRVDPDLGSAVEAGVRAKENELDPKAAEQSNPARTGAQHKA